MSETPDLQRELRQTSRFLDRVIDGASGPIIVWDDQQIITRINPAFSALTGRLAGDVVGQPLEAVFPVQSFSLAVSASGAPFEHGHAQPDGSIRTILWNASKLVGDDEQTPVATIAQGVDITERKAAEDKIQHLAFYDPLTGLPNGRLLRDRLERASAASARSGREGALLFIDLDNFKSLNETFGHEYGDQLLQQVAQRLVLCVREGDTVARQSGDEFAVILQELDPKAVDAATQAKEVGTKIIASLKGIYLLARHDHPCTARIGATLFSGHGESIEQLLKQADIAMSEVKSQERGCMRFFDQSMQAAVKARADLENELRVALQAHQFLLYYQAQVNVHGRLIGFEALLRWQHPKRGLLLPEEFMPLAEKTGLVLPLGRWVLDTACAQLARWAAKPATAHLTLAVNISPREFQHPDFVAQVIDVIYRSKIPQWHLKFELTESSVLDDVVEVIAKMKALQAHGINFSLDDFGQGYSSLSSLKHLPLDRLKIDRAFVADISTDRSDAAIAQTIVAMAHSLNLSVIAEGVETEGQRDFLIAAGCESFQGFLFGHPKPVEALGVK